MLNVSSLSSYEYCPRKLYFAYVLNIKEPYKKSTSLGTIRHETYDRINKAEEKIIKSIKKGDKEEDIKSIYKKYYREILADAIRKYKKELTELDLNLGEVFKNTWPLILEESETRASNVMNFIQMNNLYGEELWKNLTPKIESEIRIESEKLNLKGIIDQLEIYKQGIVPIELKTGKCPAEGVWPGHKLQVAAYAMLAEEKYRQEIKEGFIFYLDHKEKRHIAINPFLRQEIKDLIKKIELMLKSKEIPNIVKNQNKCKNCGIKEECYKRLKTKTLNTR
ncbi:MAG: CRISPR-associated protein Cas4 [Nanoarchaeota archaeon]|nr:CRISPR-associated protein Cas4 [Nanoarchaeota archaeon]